MDAISALASIPTSNIIGGVAAPTSANGSQASTAASTATSPLALQPSVFVQFSTFVRNLLAQQAQDPTLNIEAALAKSLAGLVPGAATGGQLYTSEGLLQQYATSLLSQINPGEANSNATVLSDIADAARQIALNPGQPALSTPIVPAAQTVQTAEVTEPISNVVTTTNTATATPPDEFAVATADAAAEEPLSNAATTPDDQLDANTQANIVAVNTPATTINLGAQQTADALNPYQRAALVSGRTAFGKELNTFVPAGSDPTLDSPIGPVAAITAIKPRSDVPEEAQASLPS